MAPMAAAGQAGLAFHLGNLSGRPRDEAEFQNFTEDALANFWNLLDLFRRSWVLPKNCKIGLGRGGLEAR